MDISTLENWLWDAACNIRGEIDAPKYKDYILPLLFYKRLSDVYQDELRRLTREFQDEGMAKEFAESDRTLVRFYLPDGHAWNDIRRNPVDLGEKLTWAMREIAKENPKLSGVIDIADFNETSAGQRIIDDGSLSRLIEILSKHRLGLDDVEPDILGRAYEYLLRKFAEGSGQSAGEFYTPKEVGVLMSHILAPEEGDEIYDPTCGSGGLLIKAQLRLKESVAQRLNKDVIDLKPEDVRNPLKLFGQEINHVTFAMAKMNAFVHDMNADIQIGDTMRNPRFTVNGGLRPFDKVTANPMWNQKSFTTDTYENDTYNRFGYGIPTKSSADWGWVQHMFASLKDNGKMAVVLDTGAASRGSGNQGSNRERDIRRKFVDADFVECVILLPENLFYNTTAPGIILVINKAKTNQGEILLINASEKFSKGKPKNYLSDEHIAEIAEIYSDWKDVEGLSKVIAIEEAVRNDYNFSPSRYVASNDKEEYLPIEEVLVELAEVEEERREIDSQLNEILQKLGFEGYLESVGV